MHASSIKLAALALSAAAALALPAAAHATTVYAAASLRDVLPAIDRGPDFSFGGSGMLMQQIRRGAPADLFLSASPREPRALARARRCERPVTFASNAVALIVPRGNPGGIRSIYDLRAGGKRVAIAAAGVPAGDYARQLLARLGLEDVLRRNTVSNETSVSGVVAKVALGSAEAGFVYATDGRAERRRVTTISLSRRAQPAIRYQLCVVRRPGADRAGARAFAGKVLSRRGRDTLARFGFGVPRR